VAMWADPFIVNPPSTTLDAISIIEGVGFFFKKKVARGAWTWPNGPAHSTRGQGAS
jgi:hypothetical protein